MPTVSSIMPSNVKWNHFWQYLLTIEWNTYRFSVWQNLLRYFMPTKIFLFSTTVFKAKNDGESVSSHFRSLHCVRRVRIRSFSGPHFSRIFPHSDWIRSPYSVRMRENLGKMRTRLTPNMDSLYAVLSSCPCSHLWNNLLSSQEWIPECGSTYWAIFPWSISHCQLN